MKFSTQYVAPPLIDTEDDTYRITTNKNIDDLVESFAQVGMINPPLLCQNASGYTVVCGFRRISACRHLDPKKHIAARILDEKIGQLECATYAIVDNAYQRPLNLIEISRSINMLERFMGAKQLSDIKLKAMGLPENQALIKKIKKVDRLPAQLQNSILSNTLSLSMAMELSTLNTNTASAFADLFASLRLSLNKQREVLTLAKEISYRDDVPMTEVLQDPKIQAILDDIDLSINQKSQKLRKYLKQIRFPVLTKSRQLFETNLKTLNLKAGAQLIPPENFEGTIYTLKLTFRSIEELKGHKRTFDTLMENPVLRGLLS